MKHLLHASCLTVTYGTQSVFSCSITNSILSWWTAWPFLSYTVNVFRWRVKTWRGASCIRVNLRQKYAILTGFHNNYVLVPAIVHGISMKPLIVIIITVDTTKHSFLRKSDRRLSSWWALPAEFDRRFLNRHVFNTCSSYILGISIRIHQHLIVHIL